MPKRIAFLHFYTFRLLRGIETLVISLANELKKHSNLAVTIVTARRSLKPLVSPDTDVKVIEYSTSRYYAHLFISPFYWWSLVRGQFDFLVVFFADFGEARAWHWAKPFIKQRTKLIVYLCYPYSSVPHRYQNMKKAGFFRDAYLVLADAQHIADDAKNFVGRDIGVVPVGTSPEQFRFNAEKRNAIRQQFGYQDNHFVLLNVSALEPAKGPRRMIAVLPALREHVPMVRYLILGKGEDESYLREQVKQNNLEDIVTFAGTTTDLPSYYSAADLFVMFAENEGNSVASHEALSCQLPVVASRKGGFLETMTPDYSILVDPHNDGEIIDTIERLANAPEERHNMGIKGREHVQTALSWQASAQKLLDYLQSAEC